MLVSAHQANGYGVLPRRADPLRRSYCEVGPRHSRIVYRARSVLDAGCFALTTVDKNGAKEQPTKPAHTHLFATMNGCFLQPVCGETVSQDLQERRVSVCLICHSGDEKRDFKSCLAVRFFRALGNRKPYPSDDHECFKSVSHLQDGGARGKTGAQQYFTCEYCAVRAAGRHCCHESTSLMCTSRRHDRR